MKKLGLLARSAAVGALALALGVPACGSDPESLGTCESGGSGGKGGSNGSGGMLGPAGGSSDAGESHAGGMSGEGGTGGGGPSGGKAGGGGGGSGGNVAGSGGSLGSAGDGGGEGGGDGVMLCKACEEQCKTYAGDPLMGTEDCLHGPGVAQAGPAKSVELSVLCTELLSCFISTQCGPPTHDHVDCYCGTSGAACQTPGGANGPCVAEIEAAAESSDYAAIGTRFDDPWFALGRAVSVINCYRDFCPTTCF